MPTYPWLAKNKLVPKRVVAKIKAMKALGVPYSKADIQFAPQVLSGQAASIAARLEREGQITVDPHTEIIALIAYLQRLGKNQRPAMVSKAK